MRIRRKRILVTLALLVPVILWSLGVRLGHVGCFILHFAEPPADGTVSIPMRDGITLATDLLFPPDEAPPYPVVLIRTPYNKDWLRGYGHYHANSGFPVAIHDVLGR